MKETINKKMEISSSYDNSWDPWHIIETYVLERTTVSVLGKRYYLPINIAWLWVIAGTSWLWVFIRKHGICQTTGMLQVHFCLLLYNFDILVLFLVI